MTTDTQSMAPTDADLIDLGHECELDAIAFGRAVLAKWGRPAHSGEPIIYDPKALLEVFQKAQAGSSGTAGTLRGIAAVIASWESRAEPHTWLIASAQPVVRKDDKALIRQLVEALEQSHATLWEEDDDPARPVHEAIVAGRARLEGKP